MVKDKLFFEGYGDHRDLHVLTHSFPTRRSSDLFLNNPIIAVAPPDHPLCNAATLSLQDLTDYPLLVREPGSGTRRAGEDYLRQKRAHYAQTDRKSTRLNSSH